MLIDLSKVNQISVKMLDLNVPFVEIAKKLDPIAEVHFGKEVV